MTRCGSYENIATYPRNLLPLVTPLALAFFSINLSVGVRLQSDLRRGAEGREILSLLNVRETKM
jgi:hypothetical protein